MIESNIKALLKLDDAGLAEILGFNRKVAAFREDLQGSEWRDDYSTELC
jgi:hypothetical protein